MHGCALFLTTDDIGRFGLPKIILLLNEYEEAGEDKEVKEDF
jgi:hypothetical protein